MNTFILILYIIAIMAGSVWFGLGFAVDWNLMYKLRDKYKVLNYKPFSCAGCMAFWISWPGVGVLSCFSPEPALLIVPFLTYLVTKQIDNLTNNPFK
jgi:hypothetical protein